MSKRPIDSFIQYFLDVKPYHTKILEIVEQYKFQDDLIVTIDENLSFLEQWANDSMCYAVGYGLDFDDDSGYDSISNCDLFECVGGYGIIFDNSDILVDTTVIEGGIDEELGTIQVDGDHRYDTYLQIHSTSGSNSIRILGNVASTLSAHNLFIVVPQTKLQIIETVYNGFYVLDDYAAQFNIKRQFKVHLSNHNDDIYPVVTATYIPAVDTTPARTFIEVPDTDLNAAELGYILVNSGTKNNGVYMNVGSSYDGTYTNILLHDDTPLKLTDETIHGSVVLRTAMVAPRRVWLQNNFSGAGPEYIGEFKIARSDYDIDTDITTLTMEEADHFMPVDVADLRMQLIGYFFGAGFDSFNECGPPNPNNIHIGFSEYLTIQVQTFEPTFYLGLV